MDPLTHTLLGGALADTGLKRHTPLATAALLVGANLPDVDVFAYAGGSDHALHFRRGLTHGVLAWFVLPLVLWAGLLAFDRLRRRLGHDGPPVRSGPLLALAALAVFTHPLLDWLNTYGIRLLTPFDGRWFYGDALFIVDPWVWLLLGGVLFLNHSATGRGLRNWAALAVLTSFAILLGPAASPWPRVLWLAGIVLLVVLRLARRPAPEAARRRARLALTAAVLYGVFMVTATLVAEREVRGGLEEAGLPDVERFMVSPVVFDSLERTIVIATPDAYRFGSYRLLGRPRFRLEPGTIPRRHPEPVVAAALAAPCVRGMANWMRYPFFEVDTTAEGHVVHVLDARYVRRRTQGFGAASVRLSSDLEPSGCGPDAP